MTTRIPHDGEHIRLGDQEENTDVFYDKSANEVVFLSNATAPRTTFYANTTQTTAIVRIEQDSSGDAALEFLETGGAEWTIGLDNSASNTFVISAGGDLGTGDEDAIRITDAAPPVITYNNASPSGTFDYVCGECSRNYSTPTICCGVVAEWHDDVEALSLALQDIGFSNLQERPGMRHLADIGVLSMTQDDNGHPWTGINMAAAQWFTWSGMHQMHTRIKDLESRLESVGS
jgi:hypothetical protein